MGYVVTRFDCMYTFLRGINIHVCQPLVNLREMFADYVQVTKRPCLG